MWYCESSWNPYKVFTGNPISYFPIPCWNTWSTGAIKQWSHFNYNSPYKAHLSQVPLRSSQTLEIHWGSILLQQRIIQRFFLVVPIVLFYSYRDPSKVADFISQFYYYGGFLCLPVMLAMSWDKQWVRTLYYVASDAVSNGLSLHFMQELTQSISEIYCRKT